MIIKNLSETSLEQIVETVVKAFSDYFVKMPDSVLYWEGRFRAARTDFSLSYGMFDGDLLVGFIINAVDVREGRLTAFNTGTGVLPDYRGMGIIDKLYEHALPHLKNQGITACALEVIDANERAIKVYERIGFTKRRLLRSFRGQLHFSIDVKVKKVAFAHLLEKDATRPHNPWDHADAGILLVPFYECYEVFENGKNIGYFIINPEDNNTIAQLEIYSANANDWNALLAGIATISDAPRFKNIYGDREALIEKLFASGLDNFINQYEMAM